MLTINRLRHAALVTTSLATVSFVAATVMAGEDVEQVRDAAADGLVEVHNTRGEVSIIGWNRSQVSVEGELDDLSEGLQFDVSDKVTVIRVKMPSHDISRGDGSTLVVRVPQDSRIDFNGVSTDLELESVRGGVDVRSVSGDIDISETAGDLYIKTVSGDIDIVDSSGDTRIKTVSGDTEAEVDTRKFSYSGVSGDADLELGELDQLNVSSINGDIEIQGALNEQGRIEMKTVNGDCRLTLDGEINARVQVHTGPGGDIYNGFSDIEPEDQFPASSRLLLTLGSGSGSIRAKTVNGDINLERE